MNRQRRSGPLLIAMVLLVLAALACNAGGEAEEASPVPPTETLEPAPTEELVAATDTPEVGATEEPSATDTPAPDVSGPGGCTFNARYVADVTVPDNSEYSPGASFSKTWRVQNSGTCAWETGTKLVYVSGDPLGGPVSVDVAATAPSANVDVTVALVAPTAPGTYRSNWRMASPDGVSFGSQLYVQIVVPSPATATPTLTPTVESSPPDLVITDLHVDTTEPRQGVPLNVVATLRNQGGSVATDVCWAWRSCGAESCAFMEAPGRVTLDPGEEAIVSMEYQYNSWSTYTSEAWVDSCETIAESDETNNKRQLVIPVAKGKPDLVVVDITFDPSPPVADHVTAIEVKVANRGSQDSGGFTVEWWSSTGAAAPACTWNVTGGLAAGAGVRLTCTHTYSSWYASIPTRAIADTTGAVDELDETNNTLNLSTQVAKQ